jgi:IS5 family transposase
MVFCQLVKAIDNLDCQFGISRIGDYTADVPCNGTELEHFRKRIGIQGFKLSFKMSIELHGSLAQEPSVLINTTVQEKNITYPTDAKLAIKIINRLNKLALFLSLLLF